MNYQLKHVYVLNVGKINYSLIIYVY